MTETEILLAVQRIAMEHSDCQVNLTMSMHLVKDLRLDSLRMLALAVKLEDQFDIRIDPAEGVLIETVGDLVATIQRNLSP